SPVADDGHPLGFLMAIGGYVLDEKLPPNLDLNVVQLKEDLELSNLGAQTQERIVKDIETIDSSLRTESKEHSLKIPAVVYDHLRNAGTPLSRATLEANECAFIKKFKADVDAALATHKVKNSLGEAFKISVDMARYVLEKMPNGFESSLTTKELRE